MLVLSITLCGCAGAASEKRPAIKLLTLLRKDRTWVSEEDVARSEFAAANSRLAEERGDVENAKKMYHEAVQINPRNADAFWRLALLHIREREFEEATAAFEKAVEADAQNSALCSDFGYHLYLAGDLERAEYYLRNTVRVSPGDKRACNNLGLVLAARGKDEESLAAFLDAGCSEAEAQSNLAIAQLLRLDSSTATESLKASLSLDPTNPRAISAMQQLASFEDQTRPADVAESGYATTQ